MKTMKKLLLLIGAVLMLTAATGCTKTSTDQTLSQKEKIVIGLDNTFAPRI